MTFCALSIYVKDIFEGNKQEWRLSSGLSDPRFAIKDGGSGFENEIFGACSQPSQILDRFIGAELTTKLFANKKILGQQGGTHSLRGTIELGHREEYELTRMTGREILSLPNFLMVKSTASGAWAVN